MKKAILLIGHGSTLPYNKRMIEFQAGLLKEEGFNDVFISFNEMNGPSIEDAMKDIISKGIEELVVLPLFVASGQHVMHDIPAKLGIPDGYGTFISDPLGKKVTIHYKEPFGNDPMIAELMTDKISAFGYDGSSAVIVIAHGSPKKDNSELTISMVEKLRKRFPNTFCGFNEYNEPSIDDTYHRLIDEGFQNIIVIPLFMASGMHLEVEIPEKLGIPSGSRGGIVNVDGRDIKVQYGEPYGMDPRIGGILSKKVQEHF